MKNKTLKALYKQRILDLFGSDSYLAEKSLNEKLKNSYKKSPSLEEPPTKNLPKEPSSPLLNLASALEAERLLLILCLESEDFLKSFIDKNLSSIIQNPGLIKIFNKIKEQYKQSPNSFDKLIHLIMNEITNPRLIFKATYPIFNSVSQTSQSKIFQDCVDFLKKRKRRNEAGVLLAELKMEPKQDIHNLEKIFQLTKQRLEQGNSSKI